MGGEELEGVVSSSDDEEDDLHVYFETVANFEAEKTKQAQQQGLEVNDEDVTKN